jgi:hypothetical protein
MNEQEFEEDKTALSLISEASTKRENDDESYLCYRQTNFTTNVNTSQLDNKKGLTSQYKRGEQ